MGKPLTIGIAGLGVVGASLIRLINTARTKLDAAGVPGVRIAAVSARNRKRNDIDVKSYKWFDDPVAMARSDDIDVFVELIGGEAGTALTSVIAALNAGKHVVTANKAMLCQHGYELAQIAEKRNVSLNFEAAVGGGIPIIKSMREQLIANSITAVWGIFNGTCNYILSLMTNNGASFDQALVLAQENGYAEAEPGTDIDGYDAAHKIALLANIAFGDQAQGHNFNITGIRSITPADIIGAARFGYSIKLLAIARLLVQDTITKGVFPALVPKTDIISKIDGADNFIALQGSSIGKLIKIGGGAGGNTTASAVMGDIIDIARGINITPLGYKTDSFKAYEQIDLANIKSSFYLRLKSDDNASISAIAKALANENIGIVEQALINSTVDNQPDAARQLIIITTDTYEQRIHTAMLELGNILKMTPAVIPLQMLRVANEFNYN